MNTFPPEFDTGDVQNKMKLSNRVYNQLKVHSQAEERRMNRLHDKVEKATAVSYYKHKNINELFWLCL